MSEKKSVKEKAEGLLKDVKDDTKKFDKKDVESGKGMAILSYIIPPIPYFVEKKNKFVKYHATQGMNLLIIALAYGVLNWILTAVIRFKRPCGYGYWQELAKELGSYCYYTPWWINIPLLIIGICISVIAIIGIVNVCQGKAKELPIVNKLKIFK